MESQNSSSVTFKQSRIGKRPIPLPSNVQAIVKNGNIELKGPKGSLARSIPSGLNVELKESKLFLLLSVISRDSSRIQGMFRALLSSAVNGISQGYVRELELVGTGYRAELKSPFLHLSLGFSHPVVMQVPKEISLQIPSDSKGTRIILESCDKSLVGQFAANIYELRPPEPYGGKGVRYKGQKIRQKAGKSGGKGK